MPAERVMWVLESQQPRNVLDTLIHETVEAVGVETRPIPHWQIYAIAEAVTNVLLAAGYRRQKMYSSGTKV